MSFFFDWRPEAQAFGAGDRVFRHEGPINTEPSHDLAHVLVAAASSRRLPWCPEGPDVRLAEFNAVLLEGVLAGVVGAVLLGRLFDLGREIEHARWFVETHYAPFPTTLEDALARFAGGLEVDVVARLFPHFFGVRVVELLATSHRERPFAVRFEPDDAPAPGSRRVARAQARVTSELEQLVRETSSGEIFHRLPLPSSRPVRRTTCRP